MAEGIEEAETNSSSGAGDATTSMLSAAMPCEVHEFETYHHQAIKRSVSTSPTPKIMPLMPMQSMRKVVHEPNTEFEPMSQYLQQHRLHQQRKSIATKRKQSTDDADDDCLKQQQSQQQQREQQQQQSTSQHDDDQLSQSSCSSLAPVSPPLRKLKTEASGHGYVKCENLSPMQILEGDQDGGQHLRMVEPTKVGSDSSEGKEPNIDEELIHDDAESNMLEQSQDVANLLNSQNALAAAAAAAAVAANSASTERLTPEMQDARLKLSSAAVAHINGTMQKMLNFQSLQNLASLQQQKLGFVGLAGLTSPTTCLNSPLNLSLSSSSHADPNQLNANCGTSIATELAKNLCAASGDNFSPQMPQLILASGGQLMQGVQVAQLLIPSPQGISTQTILTIPVSQQVNSNEQLAQTLAALNNCPSNQQVHPHQKQQQQTSHQMPNLLASPSLLAQQSPQPPKPQQGPLNANLFSSGVQELLAAIQPNLFDLRDQQSSHHRRHSLSTNSPSPNYMQTCANESSAMRTLTPKHSPIRNSHFENREVTNTQSSVSTVVSGSGSASSLQHPIIPSTSPLSQYTPNGEVQKIRTTTPPHNLSNSQNQQREGNDVPIAFSSNDNNNNNNSNSDRSIASNSLVIGSCSGTASSGNSISHHREHSHSPNIAINSINRLTTSNGELTITKSQGLPPPPQPSTNSASSKSAHSHSHHHQSHRILSHHKNHHSHHQSSSTVTTPPIAESTDDESPNEPTINQTNCNVVDGIDLDEIKEFAKAFKLRRLSLGLTQTQVGQALSVTEGPAYSQSAICSALAAQMYAAQLSSQQQQNMFEKLDITPKSAQKIKPVLERWMKEAEERHWNHYKSGQSHLTDFIGVEPSKKRKRRTSFTPQALELLNAHFERNTHPSGTEITGLAHQLGYEREVIRIWFCNKRQALKNTVRMMSKGMV